MSFLCETFYTENCKTSYDYLISTVRLIKTEVLLPNLCDGNFSSVSGTDELAAVLRKRHQILSLNEHDETCCRTYFGDVLVLLHVGDQRQTYTQ